MEEVEERRVLIPMMGGLHEVTEPSALDAVDKFAPSAKPPRLFLAFTLKNVDDKHTKYEDPTLTYSC